MEQAEFDCKVRNQVYDRAMREGRIPLCGEIAEATGMPVEDVRAACLRLAAGRVLVLQRGSGEILMANPFSAVPTPFVVRTAERAYFANCIWDGLGVLAMLHQDGAVQASCGDCGTGMELTVADGELKPAGGVIHFVVPAAKWWEDVVFT